jgi:hypothetical protein
MKTLLSVVNRYKTGNADKDDDLIHAAIMGMLGSAATFSEWNLDISGGVYAVASAEAKKLKDSWQRESEEEDIDFHQDAITADQTSDHLELLGQREVLTRMLDGLLNPRQRYIF